MSLSQDGVINNIGSARIAKEIIQLSLKACKIYGNWFQDVFGWKGKLPSRILLERHKNWVHFIQPIFCRPSFAGRVLQSIILSYINKAHLLSQHPHYRHAEITGRAPHTRETCQGWDGLIKKPLISIQLNGFTFIVFNSTLIQPDHWALTRVRATREWIIFSDYYSVTRSRCQEKAHPSVGQQPARHSWTLSRWPGELCCSPELTRDNQFQTDIKCGTLWGSDLPSPSPLPHNEGRVGAIKTQWGQFPPDPPPPSSKRKKKEKKKEIKGWKSRIFQAILRKEDIAWPAQISHCIKGK